jgi:hypothetical protein
MANGTRDIKAETLYDMKTPVEPKKNVSIADMPSTTFIGIQRP